MRLVYDDTMLSEFVKAAQRCISNLKVDKYCKYEYGAERVQRDAVKTALTRALAPFNFSIGNTSEHAFGLGNCYPAIYHCPVNNEHQICGFININSGMLGELYIHFSDFRGNHVGTRYELQYQGIRAFACF